MPNLWQLPKCSYTESITERHGAFIKLGSCYTMCFPPATQTPCVVHQVLTDSIHISRLFPLPHTTLLLTGRLQKWVAWIGNKDTPESTGNYSQCFGHICAMKASQKEMRGSRRTYLLGSLWLILGKKYMPRGILQALQVSKHTYGFSVFQSLIHLFSSNKVSKCSKRWTTQRVRWIECHGLNSPSYYKLFYFSLQLTIPPITTLI